jgi:threonine dehydratase
MVTFEDIKEAQKTIAPYIKHTSLFESNFLSELIQGRVYLKLENEQVTHSFKIRGVMNKLLSLTEEEKVRGIVTASAGNHGQAVAFGAQKLGFSSRIVVPKKTPQVKLDGIRQFGAELLLFGDTYGEAEQKAKQIAMQEKRLYVSPYNDELIVAGHGSVGLEILSDLPNFNDVVVPVGGGGLIAGVSIAVKNQTPISQVIGVQSQASPVMFESLKAGRIVPAHRHERYTVAEGLAGSVEKNSITFGIIQKYVNDVMVVREESIRHAVCQLWNKMAQRVEGSGATGVALLQEEPKLFEGKTIALVVTGGNIDDSLLESLLAED